MSAEELARIEKLVADAIGIDVERGDSLTVSKRSVLWTKS